MRGASTAAGQDVRLDKWLWAARFFKTRAIATTAVNAGHIHLNGDKAKPARNLRIGDRLRIKTIGDEFEVLVAALSDHRGPAAQAQALYTETEASVEARARRKLEHSLAPTLDHPNAIGRPTKKLRRVLNRFQQSYGD